jgi:hypothetical protein
MSDTSAKVADSISATNHTVLGSSPDVAISIFYQAAGQAFSLTMQNAASNQQNLNSLNPSIVAQALKLING